MNQDCQGKRNAEYEALDGSIAELDQSLDSEFCAGQRGISAKGPIQQCRSTYRQVLEQLKWNHEKGYPTARQSTRRQIVVNYWDSFMAESRSTISKTFQKFPLRRSKYASIRFIGVYRRSKSRHVDGHECSTVQVLLSSRTKD